MNFCGVLLLLSTSIAQSDASNLSSIIGGSRRRLRHTRSHEGAGKTTARHRVQPGSNMAKNIGSPGSCDNDSNIQLSDEARLIRDLLHVYRTVGTLARPVKNSSQSLHIEFQMTLVQILDFDETKQLLITNIWKSFSWSDELLTWNPAQYGGITDLRLPPSTIWTPDVVLYNNADEQYDKEIHHELIAVLHNGTVKWIPSAIYKSSCEVNMENFPFDAQECHFKFGSWTYDGNKLDLHFLSNSSDLDMNEYVQSSEWDLERAWGVRNVRHYSCCGTAPYPELIYRISIRRRTAFYVVVLVLPCILLSSLTLAMFWFPPQRPDRTGLGMSLFSSFFVLLLILVQSSPPTAHSISLLGTYYCINMIMIAMSTTLSALVINLYKSKGHTVPVPKWLMKLNNLSWTRLWMRSQGLMVEKLKKPNTKSQSARLSTGALDNPPEPLRPKSGFLGYQINAQGIPVMEWKRVAQIVDRVCFFVYIAAFILAMVLVFPR